MNYFLDAVYEQKYKNLPESVIGKNYFKFKTTIILHMIAFVDKDKIKIVFKKCNLFYLSLYNHIMKSLALDTSDSLSSKKIRIELEDLDIYSNMFDRLNIDAHFEIINYILCVMNLGI